MGSGLNVRVELLLGIFLFFSLVCIRHSNNPLLHDVEEVSGNTSIKSFYSIKAPQQEENITIDKISNFTAGANFDLVWNASSFDPLGYNITRGALLLINETWNGSLIIYNESLATGHESNLTYTCTVWNVNFTTNSSTVTVFVDAISPTFSGATSEFYFRDDEILTLTWLPSDNHPENYTIERARYTVGSLDWTVLVDNIWNGNNINYYIITHSLSVGEYYFRCNVTDEAGNIASNVYLIHIFSNVPDEIWGGLFGLNLDSDSIMLGFLAVLTFVIGVGAFIVVSQRFRKPVASGLDDFGKKLEENIRLEDLDLNRTFTTEIGLCEHSLLSRADKAGENAVKTTEKLTKILVASENRITHLLSSSKYGKAFKDLVESWKKTVNGYHSKLDRLTKQGKTFTIARRLDKEIHLLERQGAGTEELKRYLKDPKNKFSQIINWGHSDILNVAFTSKLALQLVVEYSSKSVEGISKVSSWSKLTAMQQYQKKRGIEQEIADQKSDMEDLVGEVRNELDIFLRRYTHQIRTFWKENQYSEALEYSQGILETGLDYLDQYGSRFDEYVANHLKNEEDKIHSRFEQLPSIFGKAREVNLNKLKTLQHSYIVKTVERCILNLVSRKESIDYLEIQEPLKNLDEIQLATILTRFAKENESIEFNEITQQITRARPKCIVCWTEISKGQESRSCPHCGARAHKEHWLEIARIGFCPKCKKRVKK